MKKIFITLFAGILVLGITGCSNTTDLISIADGLTNYYIIGEYDEQLNTFSASQTVEYINNEECVLEEVAFHLYTVAFQEGVTNAAVSASNVDRAYYNGINYGTSNISNITVNGDDADIRYGGTDCDILYISLSSALEIGESVNISMDYTLTLPNINHRYGYGENTINLSGFYPVVCVYENGVWSTNPYDSNGDPFYTDMANYFVELTHSNELVVAASGNMTDVDNGDKTTTNIEMLVARDIAIVMSNDFEIISTTSGGVEIMYYYFDDDIAEENLQTAVDAINTFSNLFGDYIYDTYSVVETDFYQGGMEFSGLVYISTEVTDADTYKNVIVHETAHQWWYGLVGSDAYSTAWIDESLTEYCTALFYEYNDGYNYNYDDIMATTYQNISIYMNVYGSVFDTLDTSMNRSVNEYDFEAEYVYMVYVKGALMYDSLTTIIGVDNLISSLKSYASTYAYGLAYSDSLIDIIESTTGLEVSSFFDSWLNGTVVLN